MNQVDDLRFRKFVDIAFEKISAAGGVHSVQDSKIDQTNSDRKINDSKHDQTRLTITAGYTIPKKSNNSQNKNKRNKIKNRAWFTFAHCQRRYLFWQYAKVP